jgi:hypothetical protein
MLLDQTKDLLNDSKEIKEKLGLVREDIYKYISQINKYIRINYLDGYRYDRLSQIMEPCYNWLNSDLQTDNPIVKGYLDNNFELINNQINKVLIHLDEHHSVALKRLDNLDITASKIDRGQLKLYESINEAIENKMFSDLQLDEILNAISDFIKESKETDSFKSDRSLRDRIDKTEEVLRSAEINVSQKVEYALPIITPLANIIPIQYKGSVELKCSLDLQAAYNKLVNKLNMIKNKS